MSKYNNGKEYITLDSIAAAGADAVLNAGTLTVGDTTVGKISIPYKRIRRYKKTSYTAEVAQVSTLTPTAANDTTYWVVISQEVGSSIVYRKYTYVSDASATATEICNNFRTMINSDAAVKLAATGTTTLVLTADTGYAKFKVSASTNIAIVATTAGVVGVNSGTLLDAAGFDVTTSNNYTSFEYEYEDVAAGSNPNEFMSNRKIALILANEGEGDFADFETAMDNAGTADDGAGVADPDAIAIA